DNLTKPIGGKTLKSSSLKKSIILWHRHTRPPSGKMSTLSILSPSRSDKPMSGISATKMP
ncbi:MAG: hypothetical protein KC563_05930, partial [Nitrospira sp.]|nr:hypothetical protein [Nitrospira sp.]